MSSPGDPLRDRILRFLGQSGPLRTLLFAAALALAASAPFAGGETHYASWRILPTVIAPTLAIMLAFVLALDVLMSWVFMVDRRGAERTRYRVILRVEAVLLGVLVLSWLPFFTALLRAG